MQFVYVALSYEVAQRSLVLIRGARGVSAVQPLAEVLNRSIMARKPGE